MIFNYISHLHNCTLIFCFLFCFPWSSAPIFVSARTNKRQQGHERRCSSRALLRALSVAGVQMRIAGEFIETYGHRGSNSGPRDDALPNLTHPACDWAAHSDRRRASELCCCIWRSIIIHKRHHHHGTCLLPRSVDGTALLPGLGPNFPGIGVLGPATGSHVVNRGTPVATLGLPQLNVPGKKSLEIERVIELQGMQQCGGNTGNRQH